MSIRSRIVMPYAATMLLLLHIFASPLNSRQVPPNTANRQILICVSDHADPSIVQAVNALVENASRYVVLKALVDTQEARPARKISSEEILHDYNLAAYNHLIVIGLKSEDALVAKVWEHYATVNEAAKTINMLGWGTLAGDIGYIEGDRNPFLHSRRIKAAPFETVIFKLSGTSPAGVVAAIKAFENGMLNGLVPAGAFSRPIATILDLDPVVMASPLHLPSTVTLANYLGMQSSAPIVGWTQVPGNEYRAYLDVAGFEPVRIWRYKYLVPNAFDRAGIPGWMAGFQRMAFGNVVNIVEFSSSDQAAKTAAAIGNSNGWTRSTILHEADVWQADQQTDEQMPVSPGEMFAFTHANYLILSTLPSAATAAVAQGL